MAGAGGGKTILGPTDVLTIGDGLLAVSVIPQYVALALGKARPLVLINLAAGFQLFGGSS